jgi:hypothetical protein
VLISAFFRLSKVLSVQPCQAKNWRSTKCSVFGRAEARDFLDLSALTKRYGLVSLMQRAVEKDPGFDPEIFREMLTRFGRLPRDEFEISDDGYQKLIRTVDHWQSILTDLSLDRLHNKELGRDNDLGLGL